METRYMSRVMHECQFKCKSEKHGSNLNAALTKDSLTDEKLASYLKWCCVKYAEASDENGRSLLHMAAAKGRIKLLKFLLKHEKIDIHKKDKESNFSPLHCSLFYGHINCAVQLIKAGADIEQFDMDELTPLDHIAIDKPVNVRDIDAGSHDVYVWGINKHFILGTGDQEIQDHPEPMETFRNQKIYLKKVVLSKYHSAFLARDGRLWMCGNGYGGRLGFEKEMVLQTPKIVDLNATSKECHAVALGRDHTIVVMGDKTVWSFGLNTFHQLGHDPPPEKVLIPKFIRGLRHVGIVGASASKYHSAFWSDSRLYTCGLNAGQLGHTKDLGRTVIVPKSVNGLRQCGIKVVICTYGATVLANSYGEIYLFYGYICRKITSRPFYPKLLCALGGQLDYKVDPQRLQEDGGGELQVLVVTTCNAIYLWKESDRKYLKYHLNFNHRVIHITDITFNGTFLILTTKDGNAYYGDIVGKRAVGSEIHGGSSHNHIKLSRISYIHRAVMVTSDVSGKNFAIIQYQPKSRLYNFPRSTYPEADEHMKNLFRLLETTNYFQDVVFEVQGCRFSAHRFIVGHASKVLENMMNEGIQPDGTCKVKIDSVSPQIFRALLCYIYTRDFNLVSPYTNIPRFDIKRANVRNKFCEVKLPFQTNGHSYRHVKDSQMTGKEKNLYMKLLEKAASILGVKNLLDEFQGEDIMFKKARIFPTSLVKFDRERFSYLWDIRLRSDDGTEINAHKCILVSRLEYFNCMMNNKTWIESGKKKAVTLPISGTVLTVLINYLYTGAAPLILKTNDLDLVFMTLVVADQLFCNGLKSICEYSLSQLMTLDNASDIFLVGLTFNAADLKRYASEFICQNLSYLLEIKALENLPEFVLAELSVYYRSRVPQMCMRQITAFSNAPDEEFVEKINKTEPVSLDEIEEKPRTRSGASTPKKKRINPLARPRSKSLDSTPCEPKVELFPNILIPFFGEVKKKDAPWIKVLNQHTRKPKKNDWKVKTTVEVSQDTLDLVKDDKNFRVRLFPVKSISMNSLRDIQCPSTSSEKDFPALKRSASERNIDSYPPSRRLNAVSEIIHKFSLSLGRGSFSLMDSSEDIFSNQTLTMTRNQSATAAMSPWYFPESDSDTDDTFSSDESSSSSSASSLIFDELDWTCTGGILSNFQHFMVRDRNHGRQLQKLKAKSTAHLEIEERAIEELKIFYNMDIVKDERITIRRSGSRVPSPLDFDPYHD